MKECSKCNEIKPLLEFYKHPKMADGRLSKCKECTKADVRANRKAKIDYYRAYDRARGNRQPEGYSKAYYENNREKALESKRAWARNNVDKKAAHVAFRNAVRDGRVYVADACWHCGGTPVEGHHASYAEDMRLAVTWLCRGCHGEVHRMANEIARKTQAA